MIEQGYSVEEIVHINPFQANDITTNDKTLTTDYQNTDDWVINKLPIVSSPGDIKGADFKIRESSNDSNWQTRHRSPIDKQGRTFWTNLKQKQYENKKYFNNSFVDSPIKLPNDYEQNIKNLK